MTVKQDKFELGASLPTAADGVRSPRAWWVVFLLVVAMVAAYWPAIQGSWIWDDDAYVTMNRAVQSADGWWRAWVPGQAPQFYPLVFNSFWLQFQLHGLNPLWFHVVNVALHALSTVLLWRILVQLRVPGALFAATLFALHPVQVESVAWITERKNVLSMVFALTSVLWWVRGRDQDRKMLLVLSFGAYAAALLSKTTAVAVPVAIFAIEWWRARADTRTSALRTFAPCILVLFFAAGIAAGLHTAYVEASVVGAVGPEFSKTFAERLAQAAQAWWFYPATWLWPANLAFMRGPFEQGPEGWLPWIALAGICAVCACAVWLAVRGARGPLALLIIYCAGIFPALGFINLYPLRYSPVADHFGYVAGLAMCVGLGWCGASAVRAISIPLHRAAPLLASVVAIILATLTWAQSWQYKDEPTLWAWTLRTNPDAWLAANFVGGQEIIGAQFADFHRNQAAKQAHLEAAEKLIERAVRGSERLDMSALANLSEVRRLQGRLLEALELINEALAVNDSFASTYLARARIHEQLGNTAEATADFERAAALSQLDPNVARELMRARAAAADHAVDRGHTAAGQAGDEVN